MAAAGIYVYDVDRNPARVVLREEEDREDETSAADLEAEAVELADAEDCGLQSEADWSGPDSPRHGPLRGAAVSDAAQHGG